MNRWGPTLLMTCLRGVVTILLCLFVAAPTLAELTQAQQEAAWKNFSNWDKAVGISSKAFQSLAGNDDTNALFEDYGDAVLIVNVSKELFHSGNLQAALTLLKDKLQDKMIEKLAPNMHSWLGWMSWAKTGMELFKDVIFDPMVEQSQLDTYIGMREAGNGPEDAYAAVRGEGYSIERAKTEFKKQYGDGVFVKGTNDILPKWRDKFMYFLKAGFETKYQQEILRDMRIAAMKEAQQAEARLPALREQILALLRQFEIESIVLSPATANIRPGESVAFTAIANYKDKYSPTSASDVSAKAVWSGADGNVFTAGNKAGKTVVVRAEYAGLTGTATVHIVDDADTTGKSVEDLLKEFGDEEGGDDGTGRTKTVGEELLLDVQRTFDDAVADFENCHADFQSRLNSLAGEPTEVICHDGALSNSYACMEDRFAIIADAYAEAHTRLSSAAPHVEWTDVGMASDLDPNETGINAMDQITIILINTKYGGISQSYYDSQQMLASSAPGCDPDDLKDAATHASGGTTSDGSDGYDDGSGDGGYTGGGGANTGDGNIGGGGGNTGGGGETGEVYYRRIGSPSRTGPGTSTVSCTGANMTLKLTTQPRFPEEVHPGKSYTIEVRPEWRTSGNVESVDVALAVTFIDPQKTELREYNEFGGIKVIHFAFSTHDISFDQRGGVISIGYGGALDCGESTAQIQGTNITQAYQRVTR